MKLNFKVISVNSIHIELDQSGADQLIADLQEVDENRSRIISIDPPAQYRGKELRGLNFVLKEDGEYVYFEKKLLNLEIESEMIDEFILFLKNAINDGGFRTPELISFLPKSKKEKGITLYGIFVNE